MSKEIHPTQQAYADGLKHGKELCAIPWRKPSEMPQHDSDVLVLTQDFAATGCIAARYWVDSFCWDTSSVEWKALNPEEVVAWIYKNELPLPDWVQK